MLISPSEHSKNARIWGVDIFLFASGIGCLYSLKKDDNCSRFIKRRAYCI